MDKIKAILIGDNISSNSTLAFETYEKQRLGEKSGEKIQYLLVEALYLLESSKLDLYSKGKKLTKEQAYKKFEKIDKKFLIKYAVFKDLRSRGYIVKTALKFGAEFRVYDKKDKIGKDHAKWVLFPVSENEKLTWHEFSAKNRVSHSTKKKLLIAIVDGEQDVSYYEVSWIRP